MNQKIAPNKESRDARLYDLLIRSGFVVESETETVITLTVSANKGATTGLYKWSLDEQKSTNQTESEQAEREDEAERVEQARRAMRLPRLQSFF